MTKRPNDTGLWWRPDASGNARWMTSSRPKLMSSAEAEKFVLWMMQHARANGLAPPTWPEVLTETQLLAARFKCQVRVEQVQAAYGTVPLVLKNKRGRPKRKWPKPASDAE